jgi:DNA-binding transcriptional regulator YiaG
MLGKSEVKKSNKKKAGAEKLVEALREWRQKNGLSQRAVAEVMTRAGVPITVTTIRQWEQGVRRPGRMASTLVERFLDGHAVVGKDDRPVCVKGRNSIEGCSWCSKNTQSFSEGYDSFPRFIN